MRPLRTTNNATPTRKSRAGGTRRWTVKLQPRGQCQSPAHRNLSTQETSGPLSPQGRRKKNRHEYRPGSDDGCLTCYDPTPAPLSDLISVASGHFSILSEISNVSSSSSQQRQKQLRPIRVLSLSLTMVLVGTLVYISDVKTALTIQALRGGTLRRTLLSSDRSLVHLDQYPFTNLAEVSDPFFPEKSGDTPFFWQIPKAGGTTLKYVMGKCLDKVQASRSAQDYCDVTTDKLEVCRTPKEGRIVNVDTSDHAGLARASKLNLVQSGLADVIVSSRFFHATSLFDANHKGRMFTVMRDPVERAVSTFYYLQEATWERRYSPELKDISLIEYARRESTASNWMVRWLTGKNTEPELSVDDLKFAKEVLRRKFLILLTDDMENSVSRLMRYFHWDRTVPGHRMAETRLCLRENVAKELSHNSHSHPIPEKGSPEYEAILKINELDMELYKYAQTLFVEQWSVLYKGVGVKREHEWFGKQLASKRNEIAHGGDQFATGSMDWDTMFPAKGAHNQTEAGPFPIDSNPREKHLATDTAKIKV